MGKAGLASSLLSPQGTGDPWRLLFVTQCDVCGQHVCRGEGGQLNVLWLCTITEGFSTVV